MTQNRARVSVAALLSMLSVACSFPNTDIVSTSSEDVGHFEMISSTVADHALHGVVCASRIDRADLIAQRIVQQLANHSLAAITLDVYVGVQPVGRYERSDAGVLRRVGTPPPSKSCMRGGRAAGGDA